jgi:hypothetical protein
VSQLAADDASEGYSAAANGIVAGMAVKGNGGRFTNWYAELSRRL